MRQSHTPGVGSELVIALAKVLAQEGGCNLDADACVLVGAHAQMAMAAQTASAEKAWRARRIQFMNAPTRH